MKVRDIVTVVVLLVSLGANAWFANERLERKFYDKGLVDGRKALANQVIKQVETTGRLAITTDSGRQIPMVVQRQAPQPPSMLGAMAAGQAAAKMAQTDPNTIGP